MLFFVICTALVVAGIIAFNYCENELIIDVTTALGLVSGIALIIISPIAIANNLNAEAELAAMEARYESLTYQLESYVYDNYWTPDGIRALYEDITEWNEKVAKNKVRQNGPWAGAFVPDIYDDLQLIEFPEVLG